MVSKDHISMNLVNYNYLIYEVLRGYPANFMKISPLDIFIKFAG